jgi:hypothetical protein
MSRRYSQAILALEPFVSAVALPPPEPDEERAGHPWDPDALICACEDDGIREIAYEDADPVRLTRSFLDARERFLRELLA